MTKAQRAERQDAIDKLREWIKPGDTVYTILEHVSRSGMSREIRVVLPYAREDGTIDHLHPNHAIGKALGLRQGKRDGLIVGGCGMDMGFHLVYELSYSLYPEYRCLGNGNGSTGGRKCPSNYHVNHRDRIPCEGAEGQRCYQPHAYGRYPVAEDWPKRMIDVGEGATVSAGYLACLLDDDGNPIKVCPVCEGAGTVPNPDGPERWDLVHTDGYALRQRWL